jgi:hypothetical protein
MTDLFTDVARRLKGASLSLNTYAIRRGLAKLPVLVRRQKRLERRLTRLELVAAQEKATRDAIDQLLVAEGLTPGEGVTCLGFDVVHHARAGRTSICPARLRAAGVAEVDIQFATVTGTPSSFATVRPMKGTAVARAA